MLLLRADGSNVTALVDPTPAQNYNFVEQDGSWPGVVAVRVQSTAGFTLTEVAVQAGPCTQWATTDLGAVQQVSMLRVRFWSPDADTTTLLTSVDAVTWTTIDVSGGRGVGGSGRGQHVRTRPHPPPLNHSRSTPARCRR